MSRDECFCMVMRVSGCSPWWKGSGGLTSLAFFRGGSRGSLPRSCEVHRRGNIHSHLACTTGFHSRFSSAIISSPSQPQPSTHLAHNLPLSLIYYSPSSLLSSLFATLLSPPIPHSTSVPPSLPHYESRTHMSTHRQRCAQNWGKHSTPASRGSSITS